jgi:hypothetical protein
MSISMDYVLRDKGAGSDWEKHPFYNKSVVLGLDIGIRGIGVWLRKGPEPLFAQTFLVNIPDAAPLADRRQKRS